MINITSEFLSLFYYVKDQVLAAEFIEQEQNVSLDQQGGTSLYVADSIMVPSPVGKARGWVYFDETSSGIDITQEQVDRVVVYKQGGGTISTSDYEVNYALGAVDYTGVGETPISADYYFNYISVLDSWPGAFIETSPGGGNQQANVPELPVVSIDMVDTIKMGYQLGHGKKNVRPVRIDIFASSSKEQKEITEVLYDGLYKKCILPHDFTTGEPLGYEGKFNPEWPDTASGTLSEYSPMRCDNVRAKRVGAPVSYSDVNRYRTVISFDLVSYVE